MASRDAEEQSKHDSVDKTGFNLIQIKDIKVERDFTKIWYEKEDIHMKNWLMAHVFEKTPKLCLKLK